MRISLSDIKRFISIFLLNLLMALSLFAQEKIDKEKVDALLPEVKQMVSYLEYVLNVLGDPEVSAQDKDVIINETYLKIFMDDKVQIEDDLDDSRDVVTNKDVQAYLKDVDFFFKRVKFSFNILDIAPDINHEGKLFFTVKLMRNLSGITVQGDSINNDQERYIEINVDEEKKELKIASIYTTKLSRDMELTIWWEGLPIQWKLMLGADIAVAEGVWLYEINSFTDSTYNIGGQIFKDTIKVLDLVKKAASKDTLNLSHTEKLTDLRPLIQLKNLRWLDISSSAITDLFPIRNLTTLEYLNCSNTKIEDLSPLKYSRQLKELYIDNTPVTNITVIENFDNLEVLHLSNTVIDSLPPVSKLAHLKELDASSTNLVDLNFIKQLTALEKLVFSNTGVEDLSPIGTLKGLKIIDFSYTKVKDVKPLAALSSLVVVVMEHTEVSDIQPLAGLKNLKGIYADNTKVDLEDFVGFYKKNQKTDVIFMTDELIDFWDKLDDGWRELIASKLNFGDTIDLHRILKIESIDLHGKTTIFDLTPLKYMPVLEALNFSGTSVADMEPVKNLSFLKVLKGAKTEVTGLSPVSELTNLVILDFSHTSVDDISPIGSLKYVDSLIFNDTKVKDLLTLNRLESFGFAYFENSAVTDEDVMDLDFDEHKSIVVYKSEKLRQWWGDMDDAWQDMFRSEEHIKERPTNEQLHRIALKRELEAEGTSFRTLDLLPEMPRLQSLTFKNTRISSLQPVAALRKLKVLRCPGNPIAEIEPLSAVTTLEVLDLSDTRITKLDPLASLNGLKELYISGTNVKDLGPVSGLYELEIIDFSKTKVKQIKALINLENLRQVKCFNNKISPKKIADFKDAHPETEVLFY